MNRQDAEHAMEACDESDPFYVGRRIMLRWGKNVKKDDTPAGGVAPILRQTKANETLQDHSSMDCSDERKTIRVFPPDDKQRAHFISLVASYVAKDGSQLERALVEREFQNSEYDFLTLPTAADEKRRQENIYYKWRVYAFCQGDSFHEWRTEPFKMFHPNGCVWVPPPLDIEAARKEQEAKREKEIERQKQQRKRLNTTIGIKTGRQMEQARKVKPETATNLTEEELIEYEILFKEQLCGSRESICKAMSFCFEKGIAAKQISSLLDDLFLQLRPGISVETIMARFYLISDILFNSQQPGVRNAFMYRDAIEKRAHQWFESVGDFARTFLGRIRVERLASTINTIFAAWATWHVFDPVFMDELQLCFEGRKKESQSGMNDVEISEETQLRKPVEENDVDGNASEAPVSTVPKGAWTAEPVIDPSNSTEGEKVQFSSEIFKNELSETNNLIPGLKKNKSLHDVDYSVDADGEPLDDADGIVCGKSNGEPFDADGEPLSSDDADGEPLDDDVDGELLTEDPDGEPLGDDDLS